VEVNNFNILRQLFLWTAVPPIDNVVTLNIAKALDLENSNDIHFTTFQ
jgi:hypothetical protein